MEEESVPGGKVVSAPSRRRAYQQGWGPRLGSVDASGPLSTGFRGSPSWRVDHCEGLMRAVHGLGAGEIQMTGYLEQSRLVLPQLIQVGRR